MFRFLSCTVLSDNCERRSSYVEIIKSDRQEYSNVLHYILWHVDPLLGNDSEISNYITAVDK
jgi:hypothetical protein